MIDEIKQVIVMRKDLNMRKGKMIAQGAHASIAFLTRELTEESFHVHLSDVERAWIDDFFTKICVGVDSLEELLAIAVAATEAGIENHSIHDSGRTEFGGETTFTCVALGPDYASKLDLITGHLKLL
jgi:PTH2 family peptidyl-tRNA hydrolase